MSEIETKAIEEDIKETKGTKAIRHALVPSLRAAALGEIVSVLLQSPRYRNVTFSSFGQLVLPALLMEQYVIAKAKGKDEDADAPATPVAVGFWACVSDEVSKRLASDQAEPIRLQANEWRSGENIWLLDVVGPVSVNPSILKGIRQRVGPDKTIKMRVTDDDGHAKIRTFEADMEAPHSNI